MSTYDNLAGKVADAMPKLGPREQRIAIGLYRLLAQGEPVSPGRLAGNLNLSESRVKESLSRWPGVYYDHTGAVIGFWGLALSEMPHRLQVNGRTLFTWCAWDSLFIPAILAKTARVGSTDPVTGEKISLVVTPEGLKGLRPTGTVVSFLTPNRAFDADVVQSFCHFVHFFGSRESGERWIKEHKGTLLLSAEDAYKLGQLTNTRIFGQAFGRRHRKAMGRRKA